MEISKEEFLQWRGSDVTIFVIEALDRAKEDYIVALRNAAIEGDIAKTARCEGILEGIEFILNIDYDDSIAEGGSND